MDDRKIRTFLRLWFCQTTCLKKIKCFVFSVWHVLRNSYNFPNDIIKICLTALKFNKLNIPFQNFQNGVSIFGEKIFSELNILIYKPNLFISDMIMKIILNCTFWIDIITGSNGSNFLSFVSSNSAVEPHSLTFLADPL